MEFLASTLLILLGIYLITQGSYILAILALSFAISLPITILGIVTILVLVFTGIAYLF